MADQTTPGARDTDHSALTIEELFAELEKTASLLESGDVPLEESFTLYEEGMKMLKEASARLDLVEKKMLAVAGDGSLSPLQSAGEDRTGGI